MSEPDVLTVHIDGAARGNPGPAAFAYVISRGGSPVVEEAGCLGRTTNNLAEYTALVRALERAAEFGRPRLQVYSDSELLVKQMNGEYRVKNDDLRVLHDQASRLRRQFPSVTISHLPRGQNSRADRLCNEVLDAQCRPATKPAGAPGAAPGAARPALADSVREDAVACLRSAAGAWSRGNPADPPPEAVWEQLWSILEETGVLRKPRPR
jgi:ribonuclease HI